MHEIIHNNINIDCTIRGKKYKFLNTLRHYITQCIILGTKIQGNRRIKERKLISLISM